MPDEPPPGKKGICREETQWPYEQTRGESLVPAATPMVEADSPQTANRIQNVTATATATNIILLSISIRYLYKYFSLVRQQPSSITTGLRSLVSVLGPSCTSGLFSLRFSYRKLLTRVLSSLPGVQYPLTSADRSCVLSRPQHIFAR